MDSPSPSSHLVVRLLARSLGDPSWKLLAKRAALWGMAERDHRMPNMAWRDTQWKIAAL